MSTPERLTHTDAHGRASMVDVGDKPPMRRRAVAEAFFCAQASTLDLVEGAGLPKGDALARLIKALPVRHAGPRPIDEAISSAGGITRDSLTEGLELVPGWRRMQGIVFRESDPRFAGRSAQDAVAAALKARMKV